MRKINLYISCTCDNNYAQHCAVMLQSLFQNNTNLNLIVYLFSNDLNVQNKNRIIKISEKFNKKVIFKKIITPRFIGKIIIHEKHININAYYKILIPNYLPRRVNKVLIIDSDLVVLKNIYKLYNTNLNKYIIGTTTNPLYENYKHLGLSKPIDYFNSGVMLVDTKKWTKHKITNKILEYAFKNNGKIANAEQDPLNAVLNRKRLRLEYKYNQQTIMHAYGYKHLKINKKEYSEAIKNPVIVHFTSSNKPWHLAGNHPQRQLYWKYLKKTPFREYKYPDVNLKSIIQHFLNPKIEHFIMDNTRFLNKLSFNNFFKHVRSKKLNYFL